eukprot:CAMPEP_0113593334 /NCGR_PEP_ID=MMETSP0015_2-20120614/38379_1 /TAXON_ID=2838 /ORGANISM="Odontella" /LENGTH=74 /DNA_ID=CAMNT_0000500039 /DNA_START=359 /DNA_END=583 /DNA_ORIENTATION=+ /assembly_acc=CAM_ASM_000160
MASHIPFDILAADGRKWGDGGAKVRSHSQGKVGERKLGGGNAPPGEMSYVRRSAVECSFRERKCDPDLLIGVGG